MNPGKAELDHCPAYGMIPYDGSTYSLTYFKNKEGHTCVEMGYGVFPFAKYPDLPVIDFRGDEKVFDYFDLDLIIAETMTLPPNNNQTSKIVSLNEFLFILKKMGITIHNFKTKED